MRDSVRDIGLFFVLLFFHWFSLSQKSKLEIKQKKLFEFDLQCQILRDILGRLLNSPFL